MTKTVHFLPDDVKATVEEGENLLNIAANAGIYIHAFCGGEGGCGKCKIKIEQGEVAATQATQLKSEEIEQGFRLACQSKVHPWQPSSRAIIDKRGAFYSKERRESTILPIGWCPTGSSRNVTWITATYFRIGGRVRVANQLR